MSSSFSCVDYLTSEQTIFAGNFVWSIIFPELNILVKTKLAIFNCNYFTQYMWIISHLPMQNNLFLNHVCCVAAVTPSQWLLIKVLVHSQFMDKAKATISPFFWQFAPYFGDLRDVLFLIEIICVLPLFTAQCEQVISWTESRNVTGAWLTPQSIEIWFAFQQKDLCLLGRPFYQS